MEATKLSVEKLREVIADCMKQPLSEWQQAQNEQTRLAKEANDARFAALEEKSQRFEGYSTNFLKHLGDNGLEVHSLRKDPGDRGLLFARALRAKFAGMRFRMSPQDFAKQHWGERADSPAMKCLESPVMKLFETGDHSAIIQKLLSAGDLSVGGALVQPQFGSMAEMIMLLREESVVGSFMPVQADISYGSMTWPKHTGASTAYYVEEGGAITESTQTTGQFQLMGRKVATFVAMTNDLLRNPSVESDRWFRDECLYTIALRQDLAKIRGDGLSNTPKGMRNWAPSANLLTGSDGTTATPSLVNITNVFSGLWLALRNANVKFRRPGILLAPRTERAVRDAKTADGLFVWRDEMTSRKTIDGVPYKSTTQIPTNLGAGSDSEIYMFDASELVDANELGMEVDMSNDATYTDANGTTKNAFQMDLAVLRCLTKHDFGAANPEAIAVRTDCRWVTGP